MRKVFLIFPIISIILISCGVSKEMSTENIPTVDNFELERYLGTWHEIARLDHSFERGLEQVTATYKRGDDPDEIIVINKGFNTRDDEWETAEGDACIPDPDNPAYLEVSFFLWFSSPYKVVKLDEDYRWAVVTSNTKEYLWILSREPNMEHDLYERLVGWARERGYPIDQLTRVRQK
ncbi:MAG: lipocalin family protein [Candidatus Kapaibacterium sp.]